MKYLKLIEDLTNAKGAPGFEDEVIEVIKSNKEDFVLQVDNLKNAYLNLENIDENKPTVMLDSHLDEVAFIVQAIDQNGLLVLQPLGGWVYSNVSAQEFLVRNSEGKYYKGIFSSKPIHFMSQAEREKKVELSDLKIDLGAKSRDEVINSFKITIGQPVVPATEFSFNENNKVMFGKAFDNRIGAAVSIAVLKELQAELKKLPFNLVVAFSSQEEVGERGAIISAKRVNPTIALILEGTPSDDFTANEFLEQGKMGFGPQLRYRDVSYIANESLLKLFNNSADKHNIKLQHAVRAGGGTDAGVIHISNMGVACATIGVPTRYAYTSHCFCSYEDFEETVKLIKSFLLDLTLDDLKNFELKSY